MEQDPIVVQRHLKGMTYPANKSAPVATAELNGAGEDLVSALRNVDRDQFGGPDEVVEALGRR